MTKQLIRATLLLTLCLMNSSGLIAQPLTPQKGDTIDVRILGESKNPWIEPSTIFGVLGILGGLAGVLVQRYWYRLDEQRKNELAIRERLQAHVFDSLKWFEGHTQKRNIGIAVIEANWNKFEEMQPTWRAILTNQAVYLLAESGQSDASHELANLERIMTLLIRTIDRLSNEQKEDIKQAIANNRDKNKGLRGIKSELITIWDSNLVLPAQKAAPPAKD